MHFAKKSCARVDFLDADNYFYTAIRIEEPD
jgi:hypothetical protein